jgi:glycosyltransferase involved in cell wall biosynthesis
MFTPLPPERTGVAHYSSMLLPALREHLDVILPATRNPRPATRLYHLGNNPHHAWIYEEAMRTPGVIVLHDLVLHHLIVEMTLARGDVDGYIAALEANHGEVGAAWARGRAAGLHSEMGNFLLPASIEVAQRSTAVIVHNEWAAGRLRSFGVTTPIEVVPHPFEVPRFTEKPHDGRVIGLFGFLTSAKRAEVVLAAFAAARKKDRNLKLLVVGEPAPNIDAAQFAAEGITFTGYVDDAQFDGYYGAVDRLVNLRYPTAGETSGTLIRALAAGKPVAVSDYAQFAELPDDIVVKIPLGNGEVEALTDFFLRDLTVRGQRDWLEAHNNMDLTIEGYLRALCHPDPERSEGEGPGRRVVQALPLFPKLELLAATNKTLRIRNIGDVLLRARSYGQPGYRLLVKAENFDRWLDLPRDLQPGDEAELALDAPHGTLRLYHAIESVPMLEPEPWADAAI